MPKRATDNRLSAPAPDAKRLDLRRLAANSKTHQSLIDTLNALQDVGLLESSATAKQIRRAVEAHAAVATPYGTVVRRLDLGIDDVVEFIHPFALMWYLCSISKGFATMMRETVSNTTPGRCKWVLYNDGVVPGNPLRHDSGRKFEAFYWVIAEWPDYMLQRSLAWATFSLVRTTLVSKIAGGLSGLVRITMQQFERFNEGIQLPHPDGNFVFACDYGGFLADLEAHRAVMSWMGPNSVRCCWSCANICNRRDGSLDVGEFNALRGHDERVWVQYSDAELWAVLDSLKAFATGGHAQARVRALETEVGFHYVEGGLMFDESLRNTYHPSQHVRDWMRTIVQDGIANSEIYCVVRRMREQLNISLPMIQTFFGMCKLPSMHGPVNTQWIAKRRFSDERATLTGFASTTLSVIGLLFLFMEHYAIGDQLPHEFACFERLLWIVSLLRLGPGGAMAHVDRLQSLIVAHYEMFVDLYGAIAHALKPKRHHAHHIVADMKHVGKLLRCFVTERKHREAKRQAVHVLRILSTQCSSAC